MNKIIYFLPVFNNLNQLKILVDELLKYPFIRIIIHCDIKSNDETKLYVDNLVNNNEDVHQIDSMNVFFFTWNLVEIKLKAIQYAKKFDDWSHMIFCSSQCLPLVPQEEFVLKLKDNISYMHYCDARRDWWVTISKRLENIWIYDEISNYFLNLGKRDTIPYENIYAGSDWFILARSACNFLISDQLAPDRAFFKTTTLPAECYPHTMLINNKFNVQKHSYLYVDFANGDGTHPKTLDMTDLPKIIEAKNNGCLFARKFDVDVNSDIVSEVFNLYSKPTVKTWQSIPMFHIYSDFYVDIFNELKDGDTFVELGTFMGKSTIHMASMIKESNKKIKIYTVDTFKGSVISAYADDIYEIKYLGMTMEDIFKQNIKDCKVEEYITSIVSDSAKAASHFDDESVAHVYVDAGHGYVEVLEDIQAWLPKIKPGGVMSGDDFSFPGVKRAVDEMFGEKIESKYEGNKWLYRKPLN